MYGCTLNYNNNYIFNNKINNNESKCGLCCCILEEK